VVTRVMLTGAERNVGDALVNGAGKGKRSGRTVPLNKELRAALVALKATRNFEADDPVSFAASVTRACRPAHREGRARESRSSLAAARLAGCSRKNWRITWNACGRARRAVASPCNNSCMGLRHGTANVGGQQRPPPVVTSPPAASHAT
jgi:hypothetical protein